MPTEKTGGAGVVAGGVVITVVFGGAVVVVVGTVVTVVIVVVGGIIIVGYTRALPTGITVNASTIAVINTKLVNTIAATIQIGMP